MRKLLSLCTTLLLFTSSLMAQVIVNPAVMTTEDRNCKLKKIEVTDKYTEVSFEYTFPSEGSNVTLNNVMHLLNDKANKRYAFIKAENIPVHPEKYYNKAAGEKLAFKVYFEKLDPGTPWIDVIERAGRSNYFNFYHVSLQKSAQPVEQPSSSTVVIDQPYRKDVTITTRKPILRAPGGTTIIDSVYSQRITIVTHQPDLTTEQQKVKEVGKAFISSWNSHNFKDMPSYTTDDVTWVDGHGSTWQGRDKLQSRYQSMHNTVMKTTSITDDNSTVRFITPTVAILNLNYKVGTYYAFDGVDHGNNKRENSSEVRTMTVVKKGDKWLLTAMQVTLVLADVNETKPAASIPYVKND